MKCRHFEVLTEYHGDTLVDYDICKCKGDIPPAPSWRDARLDPPSEPGKQMVRNKLEITESELFRVVADRDRWKAEAMAARVVIDVAERAIDQFAPKHYIAHYFNGNQNTRRAQYLAIKSDARE